MKSFFAIIDGSEDVLYLKYLSLFGAIKEVKRYLGVMILDDTIEIIGMED